MLETHFSQKLQLIHITYHNQITFFFFKPHSVFLNSLSGQQWKEYKFFESMRVLDESSDLEYYRVMRTRRYSKETAE